MQHTTQLLFMGVLGVLLLASLVGGVLKWRVAHGQAHGVIDNLNSRIKAWWVMVLLLGVSFFLGKTGVVLLFAFMSFAALREYITLAYTRTGDHMALALMFYVALPVQYFLVWIEWYGMYSSSSRFTCSSCFPSWPAWRAIRTAFSSARPRCNGGS